MQGNGYVVGFAFAVCVVCSLLLSGVSSALKERQDENRVLDRQKNILVALGFEQEKVAEMDRATIQKTYENNVEEAVLDFSGNIIEGKTPSQLDPKVASGEAVDRAQGLAIYMRNDPANPGQKMAYAYPVTGKGLWSTLYGYLAVKPDGSEVVGLTFYKHGETPGLGAEIEQPWFRNNFVGKEIYEGDEIVGVTVVKGLAKDLPSFATHAEHMVDGMSGATLTGNGVTKMMQVVPRRYDPFFDNVKKGAVKMREPVKPLPPGDKLDPGTASEGSGEPAPGSPGLETVPETPPAGAPPVPGADAAPPADTPAPERAVPQSPKPDEAPADPGQPIEGGAP